MPKKATVTRVDGSPGSLPSTPGAAVPADAGTAAILAALAELRTDVATSEQRVEARLKALEGPGAVAGGEPGGGAAAAAAAAGEGGGAGGGPRLADLTEAQVQDLIAQSVVEAAQQEVVGGDPIPHRKDPAAQLPRRYFDAQDAGEYVKTNLLTAEKKHRRANDEVKNMVAKRQRKEDEIAALMEQLRKVGGRLLCLLLLPCMVIPDAKSHAYPYSGDTLQRMG